MNINHDGRGNVYVELQSWDFDGKRELLRLTRVEKEIGKTNVRFQIRETNGKLRAMGPEFPLDGVEEIISALLKIKDI
ncbi:TPA: hypothetical protein QCY03_003705 [Bacillus tropicus]|nr:hypothetical protein [Bacillus tropicus]